MVVLKKTCIDNNEAQITGAAKLFEGELKILDDKKSGRI